MSVCEKTNYDNVADIYLKSTDSKPFIAYYERPFMIKNLPPLQGKKVLDLGCATGYYSKHCLDNGADVISIDASKKMINHLLKKCNSSTSLRAYVHDIAEPFTFIDSNAIDIIICSLVLHYIENWDNILKEFFRILKNGGKCIVSTHHPINDYKHFNAENYFSKRLIEDEWKGFEKPIRVRYFVRPLNEYIQPILQSELKLTNIFEPKPIDELKDIDENTYNRLNKHPAFLFFILEKIVR